MTKKAKLPSNLTRRKKVERVPLMRMETGEPIVVRILSDFRAGVMKKKQAVYLDVADMATGEIKSILVGAVLHNIIAEAYPGGDFINRIFEITKGEKQEGATNSYNTFEVYELEEAE